MITELDAFDYKEPVCILCGGEDFYYPDQEKPQGRIPTSNIIAKLNECFDGNNLVEAERILTYWVQEAHSLRDRRGELEMTDEQLGLYRKLGKKEEGLRSVERARNLLQTLRLTDTLSGAVILLNAATTYKAFGNAKEALPLYEKAKTVFTEKLSPRDERFAGLYNNTALALTDEKRYDEAKKCYLDAVSILKGYPNKENEMAISYVNLAHLSEESGETEECEEYIQKAIEALDTPTLPHNGYHAFVLSKCIPSIDYFGFFVAKERFTQRMKEIYERN